jgi:hypothetical protein
MKYTKKSEQMIRSAKIAFSQCAAGLCEKHNSALLWTVFLLKAIFPFSVNMIYLSHEIHEKGQSR